MSKWKLNKMISHFFFQYTFIRFRDVEDKSKVKRKTPLGILSNDNYEVGQNHNHHKYSKYSLSTLI